MKPTLLITISFLLVCFSDLTAQSLDFSSDTFSESASNDGSIANSISIFLSGDYFVKTSSFGEGKEYTIQNLPTGLTFELAVVSRTELTASIKGIAVDHENEDDINDLTLKFNNAAFENDNSNLVQGSFRADLRIDFLQQIDVTFDAKISLRYADGNVLKGAKVILNSDELYITTTDNNGVASYRRLPRNQFLRREVRIDISLYDVILYSEYIYFTAEPNLIQLSFNESLLFSLTKQPNEKTVSVNDYFEKNLKVPSSIVRTTSRPTRSNKVRELEQHIKDIESENKLVTRAYDSLAVHSKTHEEQLYKDSLYHGWVSAEPVLISQRLKDSLITNALKKAAIDYDGALLDFIYLLNSHLDTMDLNRVPVFDNGLIEYLEKQLIIPTLLSDIDSSQVARARLAYKNAVPAKKTLQKQHKRCLKKVIKSVEKFEDKYGYGANLLKALYPYQRFLNVSDTSYDHDISWDISYLKQLKTALSQRNFSRTQYIKEWFMLKTVRDDHFITYDTDIYSNSLWANVNPKISDLSLVNKKDPKNILKARYLAVIKVIDSKKNPVNNKAVYMDNNEPKLMAKFRLNSLSSPSYGFTNGLPKDIKVVDDNNVIIGEDFISYKSFQNVALTLENQVLKVPIAEFLEELEIDYDDFIRKHEDMIEKAIKKFDGFYFDTFEIEVGL